MQSITNRIFRSAVEILILNRARSRLGYANSSITAGGYAWSYLEKDDKEASATPPIVVLVHGFSSEKDSWLNVAAHISNDARVLIPDLPGHGMTSPMLPSQNYGALDQVENLKAFLDNTLGPHTPVHLVGCSMGGLISGVFAATYPDRLHSLTLICPAGISMPRKSPVLRLYEDNGINIMRAGTVDEITDMLKYIAYHPPGTTMPQPTGMRRLVMGIFANYRAERMAVMDKILSDIMQDQTTLEQNLHRIRAPTVVLWGENDQILDVSCVERIEGRLSNAEIVVVPRCGHVVQQSYPALCASFINQLVQRTPSMNLSMAAAPS